MDRNFEVFEVGSDNRYISDAIKITLHQKELSATLETEYQMVKLASKLCLEIEKLPASEQQTEISIMAANLCEMLKNEAIR